MEFNRNQFLLIGLVLLFLGIHLRKVEAFVLSENVSRLVVSKLDAQSKIAAAFRGRVIKHPAWLGLCLMSVGGVLSLQSLVMKKPGTA